MSRQEIWTDFQVNPPQVLVVGGGINGIGTFRDLALNGVRVLLVEQGDFCSGASAASSHMAHGGIRYLENGEFRLVREAVQERNRMIQNAPHLVRPLPTVIPIFRVFSGLLNAPLKFLGWLEKPSERGALVIKIGLIIYDAFTRRQKTVPTHRVEDRRQSLKRFPGMNPDVRYTATYYDGSILSPERLALEVLLDGEAEGVHARALNYASLEKVGEGGVTIRDEVDGSEYQLTPQLIINSAGPWIDRVNKNMGLETHYIGGTKGSHLVLDHPGLRQAIGDNEIFFENQDGRIVLMFPLKDKVLVGTSDLPCEDPDEARCTPAEETYFLEMLKRVFPGIRVDLAQVVFRFSGVRPLAFTQARNAGQITRDHHIQEDHTSSIPVLSLVGGKWTSFRAFSEQVSDRVLTRLGIPRKAGTRDLPIGGGKGYPERSDLNNWLAGLSKQSGLPPARLKTLFQRYGTRSRQVVEYIQEGQDKPLTSLPEYFIREVEFLVKNEKVRHLDDLVIRRSLLAYLGGLSPANLRELAQVTGACLGWEEARREAEVQRCLGILAERHGVTFKDG